MIKHFDTVQITSIDNVKMVSGPSGRPASPQGIWSVASVINQDYLLLTKDETTIIIPRKDIILYASYDINNVFNMLKKLINPEDVIRKLKEINRGGKEERKST